VKSLEINGEAWNIVEVAVVIVIVNVVKIVVLIGDIVVVLNYVLVSLDFNNFLLLLLIANFT
jgi:hypothetical protein